MNSSGFVFIITTITPRYQEIIKFRLIEKEVKIIELLSTFHPATFGATLSFQVSLTQEMSMDQFSKLITAITYDIKYLSMIICDPAGNVRVLGSNIDSDVSKEKLENAKRKAFDIIIKTTDGMHHKLFYKNIKYIAEKSNVRSSLNVKTVK